ncbi:hypothetical protein AC1031_015957 [Aphanomyces cochlioides]|nr:hypothetical protein AC1031_015957 [Aphanomyces cochlioides]
MSGAAQTSVPCTACHGLFFPASLAIHQKTCFRKYAFVDIACPSCKSLVRSGVYHNHVASCQGPVAAPPSKPREQQPPREPGPIGSPEPDGRIKCQKCKRSFAPDRVEKHQSVCQAHERVEKMQNQSSQHHQVVTRKPPSREKIKFSRPKAKSSDFAPPRQVTMPVALGNGQPQKRQAAPYDVVLRDSSNRVGYGAGGIGLSNNTSAGNPLASRRYY